MTPTVQSHKLSAQTLPWPVIWPDLFGAARPLLLEIGFGSGVYLLHLARQHPEANVIGLEISNQSLLKVERVLAREGIANVRVIHSRAETALAHLFEPATLSEVHINFPDPWFRREHAHRRLMQRDTLDALISRMQPGARLYLATDIRDYADMSAELLAESPELVNLLPEPWATSMPGRITTKYEARALRAGRPCHYFAYERSSLPGPDVPVIREQAMPHLVFATPQSLESMHESFESFHAHDGGTHVGFMEAYRGRHVLLFEIHVSEPTIEQHTALMLTPHGRGTGEYTLQLSTIGHARPTPGIHLAVRALGERLISQSPEARLIHLSVGDDGD